MQPSCIHQTELPGTSRLFLDYLYHFDRVNTFYSGPFSDLESFRGSAQQVKYPEERRAKLVAALRRQNGDTASLEKLADPKTVAVVTGQQVGFLSGPEFTIFKVLTAVKLAEELNANGVPAVPVFWAASEDHDLAEVDHSWVFNQDARPERISLANAVTNGGPVGKVVFQDVAIPAVRAGLGELPFADQIVGKLEQWYRPGATFAGAFLGFLKDLLKDFGIVFVDPLQSDIREIVAPLLRDTIKRVPELTGGLRKRNQELIAAGYHAQVVVDEDASLLFLLGDNKRTALRWKDGRFLTRDRSYSVEELAAEADVGRISPNALLRPVMQDYLLPTVSYVAGPSEIAYMAQGQVLYEKLLGRMPVIFPRNSFTLLDARASKLMDRFDVKLQDMWAYQEQVQSLIASKIVPAELTNELAALQTNLHESLERLQGRLSAFDPTLEKAAKKSSAKIAYQVEKLARKTAREALRRDQRASKDASYLMNLVYPHKHLQERFYSIVPFLAKYGWDLPQRIYDNVQIGCPHHMVRVV